MHWSPECGKATYIASQEAVSNNMDCIAICSTAFMAAVPAPDVTDEVRLLLSLFSNTAMLSSATWLVH